MNVRNVQKCRALLAVGFVSATIGCADGSGDTVAQSEEQSREHVLREARTEMDDYFVSAEERMSGHTIVTFAQRDHAIAKFDWQLEVGTVEDYEWLYKASLGPRPEGSLEEVATQAYVLLQSFREEHKRP